MSGQMGISKRTGAERTFSGLPVANRWRSGDEPNWFLGACLHARIPASEDLSQIAVHHLGASLQQQVSASLGLVHLLLLDIRRLTSWFTADSANAVLILSPLR